MYYTSDSLNTFVNKNSYCKSLSLYHFNAQTHRNKIEKIEADLELVKCHFDIIGFTETWYTSKSNVTQLTGYDICI